MSHKQLAINTIMQLKQLRGAKLEKTPKGKTISPLHIYVLFAQMSQLHKIILNWKYCELECSTHELSHNLPKKIHLQNKPPKDIYNSLLYLTMSEFAKPLMCLTCKGRHRLHPCPSCKGSGHRKISGRRKAELLGINESTYRRKYATFVTTLESFLQEQEHLALLSLTQKLK